MTTYLSLVAVNIAGLLFAGVLNLVQAGPEPITPDAPAPVSTVYVAQARSIGPKLPTRPQGNRALKAEISKAPIGRHRAPDADEVEACIAAGRAALRDAIPDWTQSEEHYFAWGDFFEHQPAVA